MDLTARRQSRDAGSTSYIIKSAPTIPRLSIVRNSDSKGPQACVCSLCVPNDVKRQKKKKKQEGKLQKKKKTGRQRSSR